MTITLQSHEVRPLAELVESLRPGLVITPLADLVDGATVSLTFHRVVPGAKPGDPQVPFDLSITIK